MISILASACEARGTDATGIAYNSYRRLSIYKRPYPAHLMRWSIPRDADVIMGHTRLTTQGSENFNYNNHPFRGCAGGVNFALAHNGVISCDLILRKTLGLPQTHIETDSYLAVQMIEKSGSLSFDSLRNMAEQLEGSFTFTLLTERNELYFVKGENPICVYRFPKYGFYIYASTAEILRDALAHMPYYFGNQETVELHCGDILMIDADGRQTRDTFCTDNLMYKFYAPYRHSFMTGKPPAKKSWIN